MFATVPTRASNDRKYSQGESFGELYDPAPPRAATAADEDRARSFDDRAEFSSDSLAARSMCGTWTHRGVRMGVRFREMIVKILPITEAPAHRHRTHSHHS